MKKLLISIFLTSLTAFAVSPKHYTHDSKIDFERGTYKNITITAKGEIKPSPASTILADFSDLYIWDIAKDANDNLYIATGHDGRVYKISRGDTVQFFQSNKPEIFAITTDIYGNVFIGDSPNGNVYKITPDGQSSLFFECNETYIWDLKFDALGNLLVATGESGNIYKIDTNQNAGLWFESEQNHIRCLAIGPNNEVYAGSSGNGYIYKIENGKPFVIFDTQVKDVNSLVLTKSREIIATAFDEASFPSPQNIPKSAQNGENSAQEEALLKALQQNQKLISSVFLITPDGYAKDLWIGMNDMTHCVHITPDDKILIGTSDNGELVELDRNGDVSVFWKTEQSHITSLCTLNDGNLIVGASNGGTITKLDYNKTDKVSFESEPIDAGLVSTWGSLQWEGSKNVKFFTRTGNTELPQNNWSKWQPVKSSQIDCPEARFLQWKCELSSPDALVDKVTVSYEQQNIAPQVTSIILHRPNDYGEIKPKNDKKGLTYPEQLPSISEKKGYQSADWMFEDANFDGLKFDVHYKKDDAPFWKPLKTDFYGSFYSWDSSLMQDGFYQLKVTASDEPSNTANNFLIHEKISEKFIIDNSSPVMSDLKITKKALTFTISDEYHRLDKVLYSINAQPWQKLNPINGLLDSKKEQFKIYLPGTSNPVYVTIKAFDKLGNALVTHQTIK